MPDHGFQREWTAAVAAVREAARLCQNVQSHVTTDVLKKKDRSPVTIADFGSQALICRHLAESFPDDPIISEEDAGELAKAENQALMQAVVAELDRLHAGNTPESVCQLVNHGKTRQSADRFWTLDPIDGTKGFLRGEQYAVSLALIVDGQVQLGILGCPNLPEPPGSEGQGALFTAVRNQGAFVQSIDEERAPRQLRVTQTSDPAGARFCESVESGHSSHNDAERVAAELGITAESVRLDSQAKYAVVARGEADIYLRMPTRADYREKIWDHAAGVLVITEAGGRVTDIAGRPLEFTHGIELVANRGIVASNGRLHDAVLRALESL